MKRLSRFFRLPLCERKLLARTGLLLWMVRCGLWLLPYEKVCRLVFSKPRSTAARPMDNAAIESIARSVKSMSRYVPAATCLTRALVALKLLERAGQPAHLRIGVVRSELGKLEAHAWVESEGRIIIGGNHADLSRYTVLQAIEGT